MLSPPTRAFMNPVTLDLAGTKANFNHELNGLLPLCQYASTLATAICFYKFPSLPFLDYIKPIYGHLRLLHLHRANAMLVTLGHKTNIF
jgi:hypothetical protein